MYWKQGTMFWKGCGVPLISETVCSHAQDIGNSVSIIFNNGVSVTGIKLEKCILLTHFSHVGNSVHLIYKTLKAVLYASHTRILETMGLSYEVENGTYNRIISLADRNGVP
jgi:hypothetical protein